MFKKFVGSAEEKAEKIRKFKESILGNILTMKDVAEFLDVNQTKIFVLISLFKLPYIYTNKNLRFSKEHFLQWKAEFDKLNINIDEYLSIKELVQIIPFSKDCIIDMVHSGLPCLTYSADDNEEEEDGDEEEFYFEEDEESDNDRYDHYHDFIQEQNNNLRFRYSEIDWCFCKKDVFDWIMSKEQVITRNAETKEPVAA